jgi:molecular chaperone GrpE (heat shock protein)
VRPPLPPPEASSETIAALMTLRDHVQTAAEEATDGQAAAFVTVARRLADILALEHTVPFEDVGAFDAARQRVVDSMDTDDPSKDYEIAASVRPGYLHSGTIERRQDVIVYRVTRGTGGGA